MIKTASVFVSCGFFLNQACRISRKNLQDKGYPSAVLPYGNKYREAFVEKGVRYRIQDEIATINDRGGKEIWEPLNFTVWRLFFSIIFSLM